MEVDVVREIYKNEGLAAYLVDNEAVDLYLEGTHRVTMTLAEWKNINIALEALEE